MNYVLIIQSAPTSSVALSAFKFAQAVIDSEHKLKHVFFYGEGVATANNLQCPPQDELNLIQAWTDLLEHTKLPATVCIAAALKRGLVDATEALRYNKQASNLNAPFVLGGLGELVETCSTADRVVTFK